ncbi:erythromycin esterase family protein [Methylobacter sp. YRD-M1]|uniref:erythromycin esterase family protein n=1 Tax=Methylobacter sp. YRD-M1 TaxID=2911520 RepID=UPI00227AB4E4|nr:erythromycin esterase family protein [Methylobacter sp. YRD-M1]WAK03865.1 erythromycin esterase family protein [Methylobacter sp. YRD-M1]
MHNMTIESILEASAHSLTGAKTDYDPLLELVGNARLVLLGEASHGTHEFYRARAEITQRLIAEKNFSAIAVEADWPDAYRINRYVRNDSHDAHAIDVLGNFKRFPSWMWRNTDVLDFVGWLRGYNDSLASEDAKAGFYGLDLYSLHSSIESVLAYLDRVDPEAAKRARYRYSCFDHFGEDPQDYGYAASFGLTETCEHEVVSQLVELQHRAAEFLKRDGRAAADQYFFAEQNARLVKNAEEYCRLMFHGRISSWNLRDRYMAETLNALMTHLDSQQREAKIVVWEHNSHLGDARATEMGEQGEWNVGQLVREKYAAEAVLVGFSTYEGTVTAATNWGGAAERKRVRPALPGSYEALFHKLRSKSFLLNLRDGGEAAASLRTPRLERAIGVVYRPDSERVSHYFRARLADQFDAMIHFEQTHAVEPLEHTSDWERGELPETFPTGV